MQCWSNSEKKKSSANQSHLFSSSLDSMLLSANSFHTSAPIPLLALCWNTALKVAPSFLVKSSDPLHCEHNKRQRRRLRDESNAEVPLLDSQPQAHRLFRLDDRCRQSHRRAAVSKPSRWRARHQYKAGLNRSVSFLETFSGPRRQADDALHKRRTAACSKIKQGKCGSRVCFRICLRDCRFL